MYDFNLEPMTVEFLGTFGHLFDYDALASMVQLHGTFVSAARYWKENGKGEVG